MWSESHRAAARPLACLLLSVAAACDGGEGAAGQNARQLPNVVLHDQHGNAVHFYEDVVAHHAVVIQFMYTRCDGVCPASTEAMVAVQRDFGSEFGRTLRFVSISLDQRDTPADLAEYARSRGMADGWLLLSGTPQDIDPLRRALGAYDPDPEVDSERSNHSAALVLGNDAKDRWTMVSSLGSTAAITRAIRRIL